MDLVVRVEVGLPAAPEGDGGGVGDADVVDPATGSQYADVLKPVAGAAEIVRGAATVISAMGDGRIAAASMHKYLMNKE